MPVDELAHDPPTGDPSWQESLILAWHDADRGVGGFHRVGHVPNQGIGSSWYGVFGADGTLFRRDVAHVPLAGGDRVDPSYGVGQQRFSHDGTDLRLQVTDDGLELDVVVQDFYPLRSLWHDTGVSSLASATMANHLESSGRVHGRLVLDGKEYEVDGLGHRDHSWGPRDWGSIRSHRWVGGSCGPDLSFSVAYMQGADGRFLVVGGVLHGGELTVTEDIDVVTWSEPDGISHRGGTVRIGDVLELTCEAVQGFVFDEDVFAETDAICSVRASTGEEGFCDFEASNGARSVPVPAALRAATHDGLLRAGGA